MVTPLQIDSYTRDLWNDWDALAIAQLAPVVNDPCYKPKIYVGLDSLSQTIPALGYVSYGMQITPGSLIYGFYMGATSQSFTIQVTDMSTGIPFWSSPISDGFLVNQKGNDQNNSDSPVYPNLMSTPRPVVGSGVFLVEVWNQTSSNLVVVPLFGVLEVVGE
jgi:hypothetical protein